MTPNYFMDSRLRVSVNNGFKDALSKGKAEGVIKSVVNDAVKG